MDLAGAVDVEPGTNTTSVASGTVDVGPGSATFCILTMLDI